MTNYEFLNTLRNEIADRAKSGDLKRSAWKRGIAQYAVWMVDRLIDIECECGTENFKFASGHCDHVANMKTLLFNGAKDWKEASYSGMWDIMDCEIAHTLCTRSEFEKCRHGWKAPNKYETWLDVQARALYQAFSLISSAYYDLISRI